MDNPHFNHFIREVFDKFEHLNEELEKVKNFIGYNDRMQSPTGHKINKIRMYAHQPQSEQFDPKNNLKDISRSLNYNEWRTGGTRSKRSKKSKTRKVKK